MENKVLFYFGLAGILAGLLLSFVSWLEVCSEMCAGTHNYRLLGMKFQDFGLIFFTALLFVHIQSAKNSRLWRTIAAFMISGALGSEVVLIWIQKYEIQAWCPVCLAIAGALAFVGTTYLIPYIKQLNRSFVSLQKEELMKTVRKGLANLAIFSVGMFVAALGVAKIDPLEAIQHSVEENIVFGKNTGDLEVYLFTDWQCSACRNLEPKLHQIMPLVEKEAKLIFVDIDIHPETLNFCPYNLSFMIHNKSDYLKLRDVLTDISLKTAAPTEEEVEKAVSPLGIKYQQLNYADVAGGIEYFKELGNHFKIKSTPSMVIVNKETKKITHLSGLKEINPENIQKAINDLK